MNTITNATTNNVSSLSSVSKQKTKISRQEQAVNLKEQAASLFDAYADNHHSIIFDTEKTSVFFQYPCAVMLDPDISPLAKDLFVLFHTAHQNERISFQSQTTLGNMLGVARQKISAAIAELKQYGYIMTSQADPSQSLVYLPVKIPYIFPFLLDEYSKDKDGNTQTKLRSFSYYFHNDSDTGFHKDLGLYFQSLLPICAKFYAESSDIEKKRLIYNCDEKNRGPKKKAEFREFLNALETIYENSTEIQDLDICAALKGSMSRIRVIPCNEFVSYPDMDSCHIRKLFNYIKIKLYNVRFADASASSKEGAVSDETSLKESDAAKASSAENLGPESMLNSQKAEGLLKREIHSEGGLPLPKTENIGADSLRHDPPPCDNQSEITPEQAKAIAKAKNASLKAVESEALQDATLKSRESAERQIERRKAKRNNPFRSPQEVAEGESQKASQKKVTRKEIRTVETQCYEAFEHYNTECKRLFGMQNTVYSKTLGHIMRQSIKKVGSLERLKEIITWAVEGVYFKYDNRLFYKVEFPTTGIIFRAGFLDDAMNLCKGREEEEKEQSEKENDFNRSIIEC